MTISRVRRTSPSASTRREGTMYWFQVGAGIDELLATVGNTLRLALGIFVWWRFRVSGHRTDSA
ncbi:hypothetical protein GCM10009591_22520 [Brachybacterium tyrofermentans]